MRKKVILPLLFVIFMLFAIKPFNGPLLSDEATALQISRNLINSGTLTIDKYEGLPEFLGAHTALYFFLLGLIGKYFGVQSFLLRLPGLISVFLSIMLMRCIFKLLKPKENINRYFYFAVALFLFSPLVIQGAPILDLDCNLLVPAALLLMILFLKDTAAPVRLTLILLGLNLFLIFWIKETFMPIIVISLIAYLILSRKRHYLLSRFLPVLIIVALLSCLSWYIFARIVRINPLALIETDFVNVFSSHFSSHIFSRFSTFKNLFLWLTPALFMLVLIFIIGDFIRIVRYNVVRQIDLFALAIFIIFFIYAVIVPVKMTIRYWLPLMPILAVYLSIRFNEYIDIAPKISRSVIVFSSIFALSYFMFLGDPIYFLSTGSELIASGSKVFRLFAFAFPAIILSGAFIIFKMKRKVILVILAILAIGSMLSLNIWQALADYSTTYYYGEKGYVETIGFINERLPLEMNIYARKDVGHYYLNKGKVFTELTGKSVFLAELIQANRIDYAVISDYFPLEKSALGFIQQKGELIFEKGNFKIYKIRKIYGTLPNQ